MLKQLNIAAQKYYPEVCLDTDGTIIIKGRSIHEDVVTFFGPVHAWIDEYILNPADVTRVDMMLEYLNCASAKVIIAILDKLTRVEMMNKRFIFNWYYEDGDDDILERGEYFASVLKVPFNFIVIE